MFDKLLPLIVGWLVERLANGLETNLPNAKRFVQKFVPGEIADEFVWATIETLWPVLVKSVAERVVGLSGENADKFDNIAKDVVASVRFPLNMGCKPGIPDHRDLFMTANSNLPKKAQLTRAFLPFIENQGQTNSCTGHAGVAAMEFLKLKAGQPRTDLSRLFLYKKSRELANIQGDTGCTIRETAKAMQKFGVCKEMLWPFIPTTINNNATPVQLKDAMNNQTLSYYSCPNLDAVKDAISKNYPVILGFSVFDHAFNPPGGHIVAPSKNQSLRGGHCVMMTDYDDDLKRVGFANSWSDKWGTNGYGSLSYDYWSMGLVFDPYAIVVGE